MVAKISHNHAEMNPLRIFFWFIEYRVHFHVMRQWMDRLLKDIIGYKTFMIDVCSYV